MSMDQIVTARLSLRPLTVHDVTPAYIAALNDPEVVGLTEARHVTWDRARVAQWIEQSNVEGISKLFGMFLTSSGKHIGNLRLFHFHPVYRRVELSFMVFDKTEWSKGYTTEAVQAITGYVFDTLKLHRIQADYYASNARSARVFQKAGFDIEGVFKGHLVKDGAYVDSIRVAKMHGAAEASTNQQPISRGTPIPSAGPSITEKEVQFVAQAARDGWYTKMSWYIDEFERQFASYLGIRYCLTTSSCTAAIHLALTSLNIGHGDEVIVPDITWVASAAPVCYTGARPVFADIDQTTLCLSPESFERAITKRTKAVVVVGLLGNLPDMEAIQAIARRHRFPIIEDAAQSIGAEYRHKKAGTFGTIGVFSFNGTKLLVTGEGGMFVTNDRVLYERAKRLSHHGILKKPGSPYYWSHELGYKYTFTNIQAALGLAQLSRIDELVRLRRQLFAWYAQRLGDMDGVQLNQEGPHVKSSFWLVNAIVSPAYRLKKERMVDELLKAKIASRPFFYPLSSMPTFAPYCRGRVMRTVNPVTYEVSPYGISLPSTCSLTESNVDDVCQTFRDLLVRRRAPRRVMVASA